MSLLDKISNVKKGNLIAGIDVADSMACRHFETCYFHAKKMLEMNIKDLKALISEHEKAAKELEAEPTIVKEMEKTFKWCYSINYKIEEEIKRFEKSLNELKSDFFQVVVRYFEHEKSINTGLLSRLNEKEIKDVIEYENVEKTVALIVKVCGNFSEKLIKECFFEIRNKANCFTPIADKIQFEKLYYAESLYSWENGIFKISKKQLPVLEAVITSLCMFANGNIPTNVSNFDFSKRNEIRIYNLEKQDITGLEGVQHLKFYKNGKFEVYFKNKETANAYYHFLQLNMYKWI